MFIRVWKSIVSQDANRFIVDAPHCLYSEEDGKIGNAAKDWSMHGRGLAFRRCSDVGGKAEEGTVQLSGDPTAAWRWKRRLWEQLQLLVCFVGTELTNRQTKTKTHPKKTPRNKRTKKASHQQNTFRFTPFSFCRVIEFPEERTDAGAPLENILQGFSLRSCWVSGWERRASPSGRTPG